MLGDQVILAPMGIFFPEVFLLPEEQLMRGQQVLLPDSEDLWDELNQLEGEITQEEPLAAAKLQMVSKGKVLPLDQAIHLSIDCACKLFSLATTYLNKHLHMCRYQAENA